jgi:hypothetical protein
MTSNVTWTVETTVWDDRRNEWSTRSLTSYDSAEEAIESALSLPDARVYQEATTEMAHGIVRVAVELMFR